MATKILIADALPDKTVADLKNLGCEVLVDASLKEDALLGEMKNSKPEIVAVRSTKITADMIQANPELKLIIRAGAGVNTIDVQAATGQGVRVANCPGKNAVAVAELAFGLLLCLDRRIPDNVADLRAGKWNKGEYSKASGICGRTLGIVGVGSIGKELASRAQAFGMNVVAWSRSLTPEKAESLGLTFAASCEEVAGKADAVSVHVALTDDTRGMIDGEFFSHMKDGAFFINTSRAEVVDEEALLKAIGEKGIKAGLDVVSGEPSGKTGEISGALVDNPSVYGTHHIGASTAQAQEAVADEVINIVKEFTKNGTVKNCVNP
jgi:D-3-phosphoglycerate dehydrogenase / 2-oxoglutarate reductase